MRIIRPETRALIFDLNGTMVRDGAYQRRAFERFYAVHGLTFDEGGYREKVANHLNREIWPAIFDRPVGEEEAARFIAEKEGLYEEAYGGQVREVDGLTAFIKAARARGLLLAVATTSFRASALFVLKGLRLRDAFDVIVTGDETMRGKPDPEIYRTALTRLGVRAEEAVAFEDSPQGVRAAVAAGVPTVGIVGDYAASDLESLGTVACLPDFLEIG